MARTTEAVPPTDNQLMARMQADSVEAWGEIYDRYSDRAFRVARSMNGEHAEEAVQEAFVSIWKSRATYCPERATPAPWLLTVVRHRAIDVVRRNTRAEAHRSSNCPVEGFCAGDDVSTQAEDRDEACRLLGLVDSLPDTQREAITLAFYGQLTHLEIAEQLDVPLGTIKGRIRLGLHRLRADL